MPTTFRRYVAVGDSFTEGLDDLRADGSPRGWADLVAEALSGLDPAFRYANLAVRSKRIDIIVDEQVPAAVAMRPDLVTIAAGGNDVIGFRVDLPAVVRRMDEALCSLTSTGATVVMFTGFDPRAQLPPGRFIAKRTASYNAGIRRAADRYGAVVVDLWAMPELLNPALWSPDRLHLSSLGHRHVAAVVLDRLGVRAPADWPAPLDPLPRPPWWTARRSDLAWGRDHFGPWVVRKVRGRALGDGRSAKRPTLEPWQPLDDLLPVAGADAPRG